MNKKVLAIIIMFGLLVLGTLIGCTPKQTNNQSEDKIGENVDEKTEDEIMQDSQQIENSENENKEEDEPITVDAVFLNRILVYMLPCASDIEEDKSSFLQAPLLYVTYSGDYTQIVSFYEVEENDDRLFAFHVKFGYCEGEEPEDCPVLEDYDSEYDYNYDYLIYRRNELIESMKKTNILVVKDYPYTNKGVLLETGDYYYGEKDFSATAIVGTMEEIMEVFGDGNAVDGWYYRLISASRPDIRKVAEEVGFTGDITVFNFKQIAGEENQVSVNVEIE